MNNAEQFKQLMRRCYAARAAGDLEGTMAAFADDASFELNAGAVGVPGMGERISGKVALREMMKELIANFRFSDWTEVSFVADGNRGALHWRANVTFTSNGRSAPFDIIDILSFRDGKIASMLQTTDSAKIKLMLAS